MLDQEHFIASVLVTFGMLAIGLVLLRLSQHKELCQVLHAGIGVIYTLIGMLFFAVSAYSSGVLFAGGSLWRNRAGGFTFGGLFFTFSVAGLLFIRGRRRYEYRVLTYLFAMVYVVFATIILFEYVFAGAAVQKGVASDQFHLLFLGGLYLLGLYYAAGFRDESHGE
jgi:hypothetical protein